MADTSYTSSTWCHPGETFPAYLFGRKPPLKPGPLIRSLSRAQDGPWQVWPRSAAAGCEADALCDWVMTCKEMWTFGGYNDGVSWFIDIGISFGSLEWMSKHLDFSGQWGRCGFSGENMDFSSRSNWVRIGYFNRVFVSKWGIPGRIPQMFVSKWGTDDKTWQDLWIRGYRSFVQTIKPISG